VADVFISFVHEEKEIAAAVQRLIREELRLPEGVFLSEDKAQIFAGDQWLAKIHEALASAKVVVLLFSLRASLRPWVNFEAGAAWLAGKPLIPCCYGNMRKDRMPHPYSTLQALNLESEVDYFLTSLHHHLKLETTPPPPSFIKALLRKSAQPGTLAAIIKDPRDSLTEQLEQFVDITGSFVTKPGKVQP
jgi:hypothetical protein